MPAWNKPSTLFWVWPRREEGVDWRAKLGLFEQIRREYDLGIGTIPGMAKKFGVHRRIVRHVMANAFPARRKKPERKRPKLSPAIPFIDAIPGGDRRMPPKQRHMARRIHRKRQGRCIWRVPLNSGKLVA
jgi:hypothetical protein